GSAAERRPSQGAQDPRRDPEGASRELRLWRKGVGHAHRGQGTGAGRGPEQAAGAALVVHPWRDPGQYEPLRQPGRVRPHDRSGPSAERQPVVDTRSQSSREEVGPSGPAARAHPSDGVAGGPPRPPPCRRGPAPPPPPPPPPAPPPPPPPERPPPRPPAPHPP